MLSPVLRRFALSGAAIALLILGACTPAPSQATPVVVQRENLVIRLQADWNFTFPPHMSGVPDRQIATASYETLTAVGEKKEAIPYLAKSWVEKPGSISFTVRTDAVCSDGTPLTSAMIASHFEKLFTNTHVNAKGNTLRYFGPPPYTVKAPDATHVDFTFGSQITGTAINFSETPIAVVCPAGWAADATSDTKSYGTGPYTLTSAIHANVATATLRPEWKWGPNGTTAATMPKTLTFKVIADNTTAANLFISGGLDAGLVTGPDIARLQADKSLNYFTSGSAAAVTIQYNHTAGRPTANKIVRQALSTAVDRTAYNRAASNGLNTLSPSVISPYIQCHDPSTERLLPTPSPAAAKALLLANGYTAGSDGKLQKDGKPLTITLLGTPDEGAGPEYVATQYEAAGITVVQNRVPIGTATMTALAGNFDAYVFRYTNNLASLSTVVPYWTGPFPPNGNNYSRNPNPVATQAGLSAISAPTPEEACKLWGIWQRELLTEYSTLPLASVQGQWFGRGLTYIPYYYVQIWSIK